MHDTERLKCAMDRAVTALEWLDGMAQCDQPGLMEARKALLLAIDEMSAEWRGRLLG